MDRCYMYKMKQYICSTHFHINSVMPCVSSFLLLLSFCSSFGILYVQTEMFQVASSSKLTSRCSCKKRAFLCCIKLCLRFSTSVNKKLSLSLALNPSLDKMPSTFAAECFPERTDVQCLHRWQKVLNPELVKGPWSKEVSIQLDFLFCFYFLLTLTKN